MAKIHRHRLLEAVRSGLSRAPVVSVLGPRRSGKTTLAREIAAERSATFLDLEDPRVLARLEHPAAALEPLQGLVVIDEVQRKPELLELLRVLADRDPLPARFLILGSASPTLVKGVSESLAGRVTFVDVSGFDLTEVGAPAHERLWLRGGFPRSFLAEDEAASREWRNDFIRTFLERDVPQLGISIPAATLLRFWTMVAHIHGQVWNAAELARSLGLSEGTARRYLDILSSVFLVRQLTPWFANVGKRQVKAPKIYIRDPGLLHALLGLGEKPALESHPKLGASWEGFALEQVLALTGERNAYFWATHAGAELDLLLFSGGRRFGVELKYGDAPRITRSMHIAIEDLQLERLFVVHPGSESLALDERIEGVSILDLPRRFAGGVA
ncbi:MAG: ATP-binding protein [Planctomycetota bacterium]